MAVSRVMPVSMVRRVMPVSKGNASKHGKQGNASKHGKEGTLPISPSSPISSFPLLFPSSSSPCTTWNIPTSTL